MANDPIEAMEMAKSRGYAEFGHMLFKEFLHENAEASCTVMLTPLRNGNFNVQADPDDNPPLCIKEVQPQKLSEAIDSAEAWVDNVQKNFQ